MISRFVAFMLALVAALAAPAAAQNLAPPARAVFDRVRLTVTGDPATPEFLADQIRAAVREALGYKLIPLGGSLRLGPILPAPEALGSGFFTSFGVGAQILSGAGEVAVAGQVTVDVANAGLPAFSPVRLAFADDPERITSAGVLSRTTIDAQHPTRLYYYHENSGGPRRFCVVLSANDSVRTRVAIIGAEAGPDIDVMGVGHAATKTFLTLQPHNEGIVVDIAGGRPLLERDTDVGPGDGIVGSLDLRLIEGGPLTATVMALPLGADPGSYLYAAQLAGDGHGRHGLFALLGFAQRIIAYTAGGRAATYVYGNRQRSLANLDPADPGHDFGDYGVVQRVTFDVDNPGAAGTTLFLYEKPLGGVVRSSFVVNGSLIDVGCVRKPARYLIARYDLGPHLTGSLAVETMTDGGSNYPLEIGLTTLPPLAQTPPISAADGCFPKPGRPPAGTQPATGPGGL